MDLSAAEDEESRIAPDLQISDYQAHSYSNDVGHGVGLIPFTGKWIEIQLMNWILLIIFNESRKSPHSWSGLELIIPERTSQDEGQWSELKVQHAKHV